MASLARQEGIRLLVYLDDWLVLAPSQTQCLAHTTSLLQLCSSLGFLINPDKSELIPRQQFSFLGMTFDTTSMLVSPTPERSTRLLDLISRLRLSSHTSARTLSSLLGMMESLSTLIPLGRVPKRQLQREVRRRWSQTSDRWDQSITLGPWFIWATEEWLSPSTLNPGVPISLPTHSLELFTDASSSGWGAHLEDSHASGVWDFQTSRLHINVLELEAVRLALLHFQSQVSHRLVLLLTDNTSVACYVNKGGGARSISLSLRTEALLRWCLARGITLRARHIAGTRNILADSLSRSKSVLATEWTLCSLTLTPVWELWFRPMIDLFATRFNHRLPVYVSPVPDPQAYAIDALSLSWTGLLAYAFPPFPILHRVIRKARIEKPRLILITPWWPTQSWFPDLKSLTHVPPIQLATRWDMLKQPRSGRPHPNPQMLRLHAWLLCQPNCEHLPLPEARTDPSAS